MNNDTKEINEEKLIRLQLLSKRLDNSILLPGSTYKIGLDPIIGLIPVVGDILGGFISIYIMHSGIRMGVSRSVVMKMFGNIALEFLVGWIPIVGDLFDALWKSNQRNIRLIEKEFDCKDNNNLLGHITILLLVTLMLVILVSVATITL